MWKIKQNDSQDLAFAINCLFAQAINLSEFKTWIEIVIRDLTVDEIPYYIYDLLEFNDALASIFLIIGFNPHSKLSVTQENSLIGIAFLRGIDVYDSPVSKEQALQALTENPHILDEFRRFFPFIEI